MIQSRRATPFSPRLLCAWIALSLVPAQPTRAVTFGGDVAVTSDYIYRGYSESSDKGAIQLDLHASTQTGTFAGVWTSTLDHKFRPHADLTVEEYIGQRFDLSSAWNTSITATNYSYVGAHQSYSSDYQQLSVSVSYLDRWTFTVAAIPNMVRWGEGYPAGRYPAYNADTAAQWLIWDRGLFVTAGAGYFLITGTDSQPGGPMGQPYPEPSIGYAYGNVGLAYEWGALRIDAGYFLAEKPSERISPYPLVQHRFAGTLSWRF